MFFKGKIEIIEAVELHVTYETIIPYIRRRNLENDEIEIIWVQIRSENQSPFFVGVVYLYTVNPIVHRHFAAVLNQA